MNEAWPALVDEFHHKFNVEADPLMLNELKLDLRLDLIEEEFRELCESVSEPFSVEDVDRVQVADALGDLLYVVIGAAQLWGFDIDRVFREVHRSNMTKTPGIEREDGKILKGPDFDPPNLVFVLGPNGGT